MATGTSADVDVIDTISKSVFATVLDAKGKAVAVTPDGTKVYVSGDAYVSVIDVATNQVVNAIPAPGGHAVAIGPQDRDGDGIIDQIDGTLDVSNNFVPNFSFADPSTFSNDFTDKHLGGTSEGTIVDRNGLKVTVWDAFNAGFYANATNGPGTAHLNACASQSDFYLTQDDAVELLCGSLTLRVFRGPVEVGLGIGGFAVILTGGIVKISEPAPGQTVVANQGAVAISIVDARNSRRLRSPRARRSRSAMSALARDRHRAGLGRTTASTCRAWRRRPRLRSAPVSSPKSRKAKS